MKNSKNNHLKDKQRKMDNLMVQGINYSLLETPNINNTLNIDSHFNNIANDSVHSISNQCNGHSVHIPLKSILGSKINMIRKCWNHKKLLVKE